MSEATPPENRQDRANATASSAWYAGWGEFSDAVTPADASETVPAGNGEEWQDWQTVDFPNALSVDAIAPQAPSVDHTAQNWAGQAAPTPAIDLPPWAQSENEPTDQPQIAELISLIQELNQCNSALIDRVTHLEEALDRSEIALQAEMARSQDHSPTYSPAEAEALVAAQSQITQLTSQLEEAYQANHQQQTWAETLTEQLEDSQARVAQLERECALLQQRYSEQTHLLSQQENTCHDLHIRLQRQQRYTLQFKAALERCLEVTPPGHESQEVISTAVSLQSWHEPRSNLSPQPFLPKVQRIQPWSSTTRLQSPGGTIKLEALANSAPNAQPLADLEEDQDGVFGLPIQPEAIAPTPLTQIFDVAPVTPSSSSASSDALPSTITPVPLAASDADIAAIAPETSQPLQDLNALVQHLAKPSPDRVAADLLELQASLPSTTEPSSPDTEAMLWQDLARLIDVSTDDVIKASMAGDFDAFETINSDLDETASPTDPSAQSREKSTPLAKAPQPQLPMAQAQQVLAQPRATASESVATLPMGNSPSPIVYPLRPSKKLESLASVNLPSFPRQG